MTFLLKVPTSPRGKRHVYLYSLRLNNDEQNTQRAILISEEGRPY